MVVVVVVVVVDVVGGTVVPTHRVYVWLSTIGGTDECKTCAFNVKLPAAVSRSPVRMSTGAVTIEKSGSYST